MSRLVLTRTQEHFWRVCWVSNCTGCSHAFSALRAHTHTQVTAVSHTPEGKLCSAPLFLQIYLQTPARAHRHTHYRKLKSKAGKSTQNHKALKLHLISGGFMAQLSRSIAHGARRCSQTPGRADTASFLPAGNSFSPFAFPCFASPDAEAKERLFPTFEISNTPTHADDKSARDKGRVMHGLVQKWHEMA